MRVLQICRKKNAIAIETPDGVSNVDESRGEVGVALRRRYKISPGLATVKFFFFFRYDCNQGLMLQHGTVEMSAVYYDDVRIHII